MSGFICRGQMTNTEIIKCNASQTKSLFALWLGQGFLILVTFALFHFFEIQTLYNQRFQPLSSGFFINLLKNENVQLGLIPWLFFAILGVGLAFFSALLNRAPILYKDVINKQKSRSLTFLQKVLHVIVEGVTIVPFILLTCIGMVWFCETVNLCLGWDSLFLKPLKTTFIIAVMIVMLRKSSKQLIDWMQQFKVSLGPTLVIYMLGFAFFLLILHGTSDWFTMGMEDKINLENTKSPLLGSLSQQTLHSRVTYFILGWWMIWVPWMSSLVARAALGVSVWQALLQAILIPLLVFAVVVPQLTESQVANLVHGFSYPLLQIGCIAALLYFMLSAWGKIQTVGDALRGAMLPIGRLPKSALTRWMNSISVWLAFFVPGWFILGWMPLQVLLTFFTVMMLIAVVAYIISWILFLAKRLVAKPASELQS